MDKSALIKGLHHVNFDLDASSLPLVQNNGCEESDVLIKMQDLKFLVPHMKSEDGLKNLMYLFVRKMSDALDALMKSQSSSEKALDIVKDFWALCFCQSSVVHHPRHVPSDRELEFVEVLPSLASLYMDLTIAAHRSKGNSKKVACQLYTALWFDLNPRCLKTALLEVSQCTAEGAQVLKPLIKKLLLEPPTSPITTPLEYLQHTVALRRWTLVSEAFKEKAEALAPVKAPGKFVAWLSQQWPRAVEYFPLDKSLKGRRVTEVMLSLDAEAVDELVQVFSECLWATKRGGNQQQQPQKHEGVKEAEEPMETDATGPLFVIDKSGTDVSIDESQLPVKKRKRKRSEETSWTDLDPGDVDQGAEVVEQFGSSQVAVSGGSEFFIDSGGESGEDSEPEEEEEGEDDDDEGENSDEDEDEDDGENGENDEEDNDEDESDEEGSDFGKDQPQGGMNDNDDKKRGSSSGDEKAPSSPQPTRQHADGMEITVFTQDSEEMLIGQPEDSRTPIAVEQTLRALRQSSGRRKSAQHSQSEEVELVPSQTSLNPWLRSSPTKPPSVKHSERTQASTRKSAADFFNDSSSSENDEFPEASIREKDSSSTSLGKDMSLSNMSLKGKTPKSCTKDATNSESPVKSTPQTTAHSPDRSAKSPSASKKKTVKTPQAQLAPHTALTKALSEPPVHGHKKRKMDAPSTVGRKSKAETPSVDRKKTESSDTPRRQYYLRNLTHDPKLSSEKHNVKQKGDSANLMTSLKSKDKQHEGDASPRKSPANKRKSSRLASKTGTTE